MVTIFLQGGLGNQMFQVAAAYNFAKINDDSSEFNFNQCNTPHQGKIAINYKNSIFKNFTHSESLKIEFIYDQKEHSYKNIPYKKNIMLRGFFQSEKFFIDNKNDIIEKFYDGLFFNKEKVDTVKNFLTSINNKKLPIVTIHIRRGDYLKFINVHGICSKEYYNDAINIIKLRVGEFLPIYVSDDKKWVENNFDGIVSPFNDEIEDLILLTLSDHNIIANSSFSWWGSYLNKNKNKIVIAPKIWFSAEGPKDQEDIIPNEWVKI